MTTLANNKERGTIYTFYSFKGGMGRTMALANVAALLAKWGHSVLVVDWDLEAPGLERFFAKLRPDIQDLRAAGKGIVDLVQAKASGAPLDWRDCLIDVRVGDNSSRLSVLTAGRNGEDYSGRLQSLNFPELFDRYGLGTYIEELRDEWAAEFEFVLVDSRTGVTDIGGICTVHLADVLVLFFTTTESSARGALQIVERARRAQGHLPMDRRRLLAVPVPARDESRTEYERASQWKTMFAEQFGELYRVWLPSGKTAHDAIELLRIPYIPYWSFGEPLPVVEGGTSDPASLGYAYEILARLLAARLDWYAALQGETLAPPPVPGRRELDSDWLERHRQAALAGLNEAGRKGYMEIWHFTPDSVILKPQPELLVAARQAQVRRHGWPTGLVLAWGESRPRPTNDGILASIFADNVVHHFTYWALNRSGDFYTLMSLPEDQPNVNPSRDTILFDVRIVRVTEALLHCANLYKVLGVEPNAHVEVTVRYGGLRDRTLASASPIHYDATGRNLTEDEVSLPAITFRLGAIETEIVELVKKLCEPLFVLFDFATFTDDVYRQIVTDFLRGKVS
jgi:cellulose biosynthesis protein BcsQ